MDKECLIFQLLISTLSKKSHVNTASLCYNVHKASYGMKTTKKIVIMAPASLIPNYIGELKFCGDPMYKLKQY